MTVTTDKLTHLAGCDSDRVEITLHEPGFDNGIDQEVATVRCQDCAAHEVYNTADDSRRPTPTATGPFASVKGTAWDVGFTGTSAVPDMAQIAATRDWNTTTRKDNH